MRVLVTGATGFLGGHVQDALSRVSHVEAWRLVRLRASMGPRVDSKRHALGVSLDTVDDVAAGIAAVSPTCIIHLAGLAHVRGASDQAYRDANEHLPVMLYEAASRAGVDGFVFASSAAVHGRPRSLGPDTPLDPLTSYARAKARAEFALRHLRGSSGTALMVVRPPVVYGPGVGGNIARLVSAHARGLPVPVPWRDRGVAAANVRDVVSALLAGVGGPAEGVITPCDPQPRTHGQLHSEIAGALGRGARCVRVPGGDWWAKTPLGPLVVSTVADPQNAATGVDWRPRHDQSEVLRAAVLDVIARHP